MLLAGGEGRVCVCSVSLFASMLVYAALLSLANERSFGWFVQQKGLEFVDISDVVRSERD